MGAGRLEMSTVIIGKETELCEEAHSIIAAKSNRHVEARIVQMKTMKEIVKEERRKNDADKYGFDEALFPSWMV